VGGPFGRRAGRRWEAMGAVGSIRRDRWAVLPALGIAATLLLLVLPPVSADPLPPASSADSSSGVGSPVLPNPTNISYNASTDGFPLSYAEILPPHYNASRSYPLLVYLHGKGKSSTWVPGGSGNDLTGYQNLTDLAGIALREIVANASRFGFILIAPSPRSATGYYTNSPCGGPEAQDTLDAIAHEKALRNVTKVYLLGFSMGSLGAISLAGHDPGMFAGIAVAGTITDAFEDFAHRPLGDTGLTSLTCNVVPSPSNTTTVQVFEYLSVMRFVPTNFSSLRIWISTGALDTSATNNATIWPYLEANDTFLTSTCLVASAYGEPANCTQPFTALHRSSPSAYPFRFVYEANGTHLLYQFDPLDVFEFLLGHEPGGCFDSTFPPTTFTRCT
jgi:pimeloyl-ACP methyl ester carboxylesterase